jgi:DNA repair photolyase
MFDYAAAMSENLRWELADADTAHVPLFNPGLRVTGKGEFRGLEFLEVDAKTIINRVPGPPRFGFQYTVNPYRGCSHSCSYCFARPTHEYLGLGSGEDFDRKIVVKRNAVELVRAETSARRWAGDLIAMGTNTDPYQPAEGKYRLTRGILEVLAERRNPVSILTKSPLVLRDIDVLLEAARHTKVRVDFSVGTLDEGVWKSTEPGTPHPRRRIEAVAKLNAAGIRSGVLMGPILPGLSDGVEQLREVVFAAVAAGAVSIGHVVLHLGTGVREHYLEWLATEQPDLLAAHRRMYEGGRDAPAAVRSRIAKTVQEAIRAAGGRTSNPQPETTPPRPRHRSRDRSARPAQLTFGDW